MKRLLLLRHAKSSWDDPGLADHERPLAPRGRRATKVIARHLRATGAAPGVVLCSPSVRTRETLDGIRSALPPKTPVSIEERLYAASAGDLLARLRELDDELDSAMLIGHNPGIHDLALALAGHGEKVAALRGKFPTAALATVGFAGSWRDLGDGGAELTDFVTPRELESN
jgi:phosphohistidine phosphatase